MRELESEAIVALPDRIETSDFNFSGIGLHQTNVGIQVGAATMQAMMQANLAGVTVTQTNA